MNNDNEEQAQQARQRDHEQDTLRSAADHQASEQRRIEPYPEYDSFLRIIRR